MKKLKIFGWLLLLVLAACENQRGLRQTYSSARECLAAGDSLLQQDSVVQGETLLRQAVGMARTEGDWHSCYIAYQRLAQSISWSNTAEALRLAKEALAVYEQHPDDERNHIILLDFVGTYAAQLAYNTDSVPTEALTFCQRAHRLAVKGKYADLICQTQTSLANIYWAEGNYLEALASAREAERMAPPELVQGTLQVLARCYLSCDSLLQAEQTYRRMDTADDIHAAYIVQSNLAKLAVRRNSPVEAEDAIAAAFAEAEELYFKAMEQKDAYYQFTLQQEREHERRVYQEALERRTLLGIGVILMILLVAAFFVFRYRMRIHRLQRTHELRLHQQEKLRLYREAEVAAQQLQQTADVVAFLKNFILQRSEAVQKLNQSTDAHVFLTSREWKDVEHTLNAINGNCIAHVRKDFPRLHEEDIQLCILTLLGLSNRAIGNIYGLTVSAVQHRKLKLKKDGFGELAPDTTLEQVLDRLKERS